MTKFTGIPIKFGYKERMGTPSQVIFTLEIRGSLAREDVHELYRVLELANKNREIIELNNSVVDGMYMGLNVNVRVKEECDI